MIFGEMPIEEASGCFLAHAVGVPGGVLRKGRVLGAQEIAELREAGISRVVAARLEPGDVPEDEAAKRLAIALGATGLRIDPPFTGRVNLYAAHAGVVTIDGERVDSINAVDEAITIATVDNYSVVTREQMAATVKIIPFSVPEATLSRCVAAAQGAAPVIAVSRFRPRHVVLVQTLLPTLKQSVIEKALETTNNRLFALGCGAAGEVRCSHTIEALTGVISTALKDGAEMILIMGATAITDRRDVIPASVQAAGGNIIQFGMPVDPGNLILLARIGDVPVLGLPGCARSPKLNGFDWVLQRLMADLTIEPQDVRRMGVGGLLMEIPSRPQPREGGAVQARKHRAVAAIILAAGKSSRMGDNKLLMDDSGSPIIARVIDQAIAAGLQDIVVVTGHQANALAQALTGRRARIVIAADFALGMSASLRAGIDALDPTTDAAIVMLGDMPRVGADLLRRMVDAYRPEEARTVVVPVCKGKRGNPVLWDKRYFQEMRSLSGDVGARHLIGLYADQVAEVEVGDPLVFLDVDTPEAYRRLGDVAPT